ncbi:MAG: penicillin acylase family protein [Kordiimonadaceae bacterium]|nr:penicillin acylase family protein [Kordiimonadaceae bacterium]
MLGLGIPDRAQENFDAQTEDNKEWMTGFTAGYNRYVRETGRDNITSWCKGAEWVREFTPQDMLSRGLTASQSLPRMAAMVAAAKPPVAAGNETSDLEIAPVLFAEALDAARMEGKGSNGWALGKDLTKNGRGMLLGNPHFP